MKRRFSRLQKLVAQRGMLMRQRLHIERQRGQFHGLMKQVSEIATQLDCWDKPLSNLRRRSEL
jgi:hypothetical protein